MELVALLTLIFLSLIFGVLIGGMTRHHHVTFHWRHH